MKWSKDWVSVSERRILDLASLSISKAKSVALFFINIYSPPFFFSISSLSSLFLDLNSHRDQWSQWLPDFTSRFRNRWAHTESRSLLTLKLEDIQIWSRLGSSSCRIVMLFPILLTGSLFLAGRGTTQWCTAEPHSPNRRQTKIQSLPLWLTHKHQAPTVTWRFWGGASCLEPHDLCSLSGMFLQILSLLISLGQKENYLLNEPQKLLFFKADKSMLTSYWYHVQKLRQS